MTVSPCPHRTPPRGRRWPDLASSPCVLNFWARGKRKAHPGAGLNRTAGRWNPCPGARSAQWAPSRRPSHRPWRRDGGDQTCLSGRRRSASKRKPGWARPPGRWSSPEPPAERGTERSPPWRVVTLALAPVTRLWPPSAALAKPPGRALGGRVPEDAPRPAPSPSACSRTPALQLRCCGMSPDPAPQLSFSKELGRGRKKTPARLFGSQVCYVYFLACLEVRGR